MPAGVEEVVETVREVEFVPPAVNLTLVGLVDTVRPVAVGLTDVKRETVPVKLFTLPRLAVVVPEEPAVKLRGGGVAMLKSATAKFTVVMLDTVPPVPVTVTM